MAVETPAADVGGATARLRRQAVRGGAILLAVRLTAQVLQWSVTLYVARLLLPDDYGMMTSGVLFVGLADLLAESGVGKALIQRKALTGDDVAQGFTLSLSLAAVLYAVQFALAPSAAVYLDRPDFAPFLRVLGLLTFLVPIRSVANALLERNLRLGQQSAVQFGGAMVQGALVLALAVAGYGYWALAAGVLASRLLEAGSLWYAAGWRPRLAVPGREARDLLRYGLHVSFAALLWFTYSNADFAVVARLLGVVALGYYSLAFQLISLPVQKLSANVNQVMFAVFCRIQDDRARVRSWFLRLSVMMLFLAAPALVGMALVAGDGIPLLLGPRWEPAVLPFRLLCPVGLLMVVASSLHQMYSALGRPDIVFKYNLASAALFPAAFYAAGSEYGVVGICLVWLVLYPLFVATVVHLTRGLTTIGILDLVRAGLPVFAGVAVMTAAVLTVQAALADERTSLRLAAAIGSGAVSYTIWMLLTARATVLADMRALWLELRGRRGND
jgi:O-antigen/teichoic acid export membrane protein